MDRENILCARVKELEKALREISDYADCGDYYHDWCGCVGAMKEIACAALEKGEEVVG